jgi:putative membrane protein
LEATLLTDVLLAIAHHLLIFALLSLLVTELVMIKPGIASAIVLRLARLDIFYGVIAGLILAVGFSRVFFGLKGAEFYLGNWVFWAKIAVFVLVGLLSIPPTIRIARWRIAAAKDAAFVPPEAEILSVKRFMHYEGMVFFTIPVFAALMARGYGL